MDFNITQDQREVNAMLRNSPQGAVARAAVTVAGYFPGYTIGNATRAFWVLWDSGEGYAMAWSLSTPEEFAVFCAKHSGGDAGKIRAHFDYYQGGPEPDPITARPTVKDRAWLTLMKLEAETLLRMTSGNLKEAESAAAMYFAACQMTDHRGEQTEYEKRLIKKYYP